MNNAIDLIRGDLKRHKVTVVLPGEQEEKHFYLIMVKGKTSKFEDFKKTYGEQATTTHLRIAKKIFGYKEIENTYGVFVDEDLRMIFAFNRDFADYDKTKKAIIYKDIDDVLIEKIGPVVTPGFPDSNVPSNFPIPSGGGILIKYSLTEKE